MAETQGFRAKTDIEITVATNLTNLEMFNNNNHITAKVNLPKDPHTMDPTDPEMSLLKDYLLPRNHQFILVEMTKEEEVLRTVVTHNAPMITGIKGVLAGKDSPTRANSLVTDRTARAAINPQETVNGINHHIPETSRETGTKETGDVHLTEVIYLLTVHINGTKVRRTDLITTLV